MGLLSKLVQPLKSLFNQPTENMQTGYRTFTEYAPAFASWDGSLYEQLQIRSIIERIATSCSKLKPEFVVPDGSGGSIPRVQRLFSSWPNDMQTWPEFLKLVSGRLFADTVTYVVPGYDPDRSINSLWSLKPSYVEVVEFEGEPWIRFHLMTGEIQAFPFYDVAILTRFQLTSDIFGGGNKPLVPTLRLMDAQRQAEEIALQTGANIRFIGKVSGMAHHEDIEKKKKAFADANLGPNNTSAVMAYDQSWEEIKQIKSDSYTINTDEMERINKALFAYFGINQDILESRFNEESWSAFYENVVEPFAIQLGEKLTKLLLTATQVRKGNRIMFSSSYLEYATTDSKIKVANLLMTAGLGYRNEVREIFQLPHVPGGDVFMVRGEYYMIDNDNNVIAESGGHGGTSYGGWGNHYHDYGDDYHDIDEPDDHDDDDEVSRALKRQVARLVERRLKGLTI